MGLHRHLVVPNGSGKLSVVLASAGTATGAGDVALVPLNTIVNSVLRNAAAGRRVQRDAHHHLSPSALQP